MRIALIESCDPQRPTQIYMPMGLAYIKSWLERKGEYDVIIARNVAEALNFFPDVIGISAVSPNFPYAQTLARYIRERSDIPIILGGPHISSSPHTLPLEFIAGVIGEGEITFEELLNLLSTNSSPTARELQKIPGIAFHKFPTSAEIELSPPRPLITHLDDLPIPSRSWIASSDNSPLWSFSSRGCPYRCTFCSTASFWNRYRLHSASYVASELRSLLELKRTNIHIFMDDLFASNLERLRELNYHFKRELPYQTSLVATVRADLVTEKICRALRNINVRFCHLGLESGSDKVLSYLKAQTTTVETNQRALDLLQAHHISAVGSFIIGAPNEDDDDIDKTWKFIDTNLNTGKLSSFSFGPLVAFPGTKIWEYARSQGFIDENAIDWRSLDIDLRAFNLESYTLLSPLERSRFGYWFQRFHKRWLNQFPSIK